MKDSVSKICPRCGEPVFRIRRRLIDRVISVVRPVQRYRCDALQCQWTGNLPHLPLPQDDKPKS
jgi:hypothetical protein